jgi:hypothetical protein
MAMTGMANFWTVWNGVTSNLYLLGLYAVLDYGLPMLLSPVSGLVGGGGASQVLGYAITAGSFLTKQIMFHFFGATAIRGFLGI